MNKVLRKKILKTIRPAYELAKKNRITANIMFSSLEFINGIFSYLYNFKKPNFLHNIKDAEFYADKLVIISVAFNNVDLIRKQIELSSVCFPADHIFVVADNSNNLLKRKEMRDLCVSSDVCYIDLPKNLRTQANLSHGLVLNWLFYSFIKTIKPYAFGFIDHDIFPLEKVNIKEKLNNFSFYGLQNKKDNDYLKAWYLWAGFCFFKLSELSNKKINFSSVVVSDWRGYLELDTGGGNFESVYKDIDANDVLFAKYSLGENGTEYIDEWQHISKASFKEAGDLLLLLNKLGK